MSLAREVERQLREAGLQYTTRAVEGLGGYTRAEFVVEASREKVHINPGYYSDAQLLVQSMERPELQYKPLSQGRGYIMWAWIRNDDGHRRAEPVRRAGGPDQLQGYVLLGCD
jgi:predicted RNase H-like nuclease (RuvC/YqgF family)